MPSFMKEFLTNVRFLCFQHDSHDLCFATLRFYTTPIVYYCKILIHDRCCKVAYLWMILP